MVVWTEIAAPQAGLRSQLLLLQQVNSSQTMRPFR
jgi:hypothetical protein